MLQSHLLLSSINQDTPLYSCLTMASESWKDVLRAQHEDLARLEALDAALNENKISDDIDKMLKKPVRTEHRNVGRSAEQAAPLPPSNSRKNSQVPPPALDDSVDDQDAPPLSPANTEDQMMQKLEERAAPETADRILRAKYSVMSKQLAAALELRKKMEEQSRDQQRQLTTEREEKKNLQKRMALMETELRKNSKRMPAAAEQPTDSENLSQEVAQLKKDLETAQRLIKQADTNTKAKDSQLKRAAETIARLKSQLQESADSLHNGTDADKSRAAAAENRVRVLERQRGELMEGFRKQLKLIDILKRQKVHLEAARLLAFTEDEFMKTLDWKV